MHCLALHSASLSSSSSSSSSSSRMELLGRARCITAIPFATFKAAPAKHILHRHPGLIEEVNIQSKLNLFECNISKKVLNNEAIVDVLKIVTKNDLHLQQVPSTEGWPTWNCKQGAAVIAIALLTGPFLCHHALAGTEVASVQDSATWLGDFSDIKSGFVSAFLLIFFSEIGDKTFFIAALLASRKSNAAVFTGTFGALVAMTFISVFLGRTFHYIDGILPFSLGENDVPLDDLAAVVLLVYFGVSTLVDAASMEGSKAEEEQQEAELAVAGIAINGGGQAVANTALATFALVFVAEWGDKSFFSTVALSAASSPLGVVTGAVVGHGIATLIAVLGGSFLSTYVSEKVIAYTGGVLFLVFAAITLVGILQ